MRLSPLLLLLAFVGCTSDPAPSPPDAPPPAASSDESARPPAAGADTSTAATDTSTAAPDTPDTPSATWTAGITAVERPAGDATLRAVRAAAHDGFDRTVFEFDGARVPGYHAEYIDEPVRQCGSGNVVPLPGDGWLEVRFSYARAHTDAGAPTLDERALSPELPVLRALTLTCDFEGMVTWVLGLASPNRYRVTELSAPARLVVDVRT